MTIKANNSPYSETATESRPLCFHIYRVGGFWGDDKIIKADDRRTPRYYLKSTRLITSWQFALHVGGEPNGVPICHVKSPYLGPPMVATDPGPISITWTARAIGTDNSTDPLTDDERRERHHRQTETVHVHRQNGSLRAPGGTYSFRGPDDEEHRWRLRPRSWGSKMECLDSRDRIVATYRITLFALSKDGELRIHQV